MVSTTASAVPAAGGRLATQQPFFLHQPHDTLATHADLLLDQIRVDAIRRE